MAGPIGRQAGTAVSFLVAGLVLVTGCSTTTRSAAGSEGGTKPSRVDVTEPGYDPAAEVTSANDLRDRLVAAGIPCDGEAVVPEATDGSLATGVVAGVTCTTDGVEVSIGVYRSEEAQQAGVARLGALACASGSQGEYVDGGTWAAGAQRARTNDTDPAVVERIGEALGAPVRPLAC